MMLEFKYRMLQVVRTGGNIFWSLAFPIVLATLYHFAFGSLGTPTFTEIPVAVGLNVPNYAPLPMKEA